MKTVYTLIVIALSWIVAPHDILAQARTSASGENQDKVVVVKVRIIERGDQWLTAKKINGSMFTITRVTDKRTFGFSPLITDISAGQVALKVFEVKTIGEQDGEALQSVKLLQKLDLTKGTSVETSTDPGFEVLVDNILTIDPLKDDARECQAPGADEKPIPMLGCCVQCGEWRTCDCCVVDYCGSCCKMPCCQYCRMGN